MERLDCPDPSVLTPKRSTTLTAIQALAMLNNPFVVRMSEHFAERFATSAGSSTDQVQTAARLRSAVSPRRNEADAYATYARQHGLENLCRLLFNTNEFLFVD